MVRRLASFATAGRDATVLGEARRRALQEQLTTILSEAELSVLWELLQKQGADALTYDRWREVKQSCGILFGEAKSSAAFLPSLWLQLPKDDAGCVAARHVYDLVARRCSWKQLRVHARFHDSTGDGCLRTHELEAYLDEVLSNFAAVQELPEPELSTYKQVILRHFMFLLQHRGVVSIQDMLSGPLVFDILDLQDSTSSTGSWCSPASVQAMIDTFRELDRDGNGTLSEQEFSAALGGGLTPVFVRQLFAEHVAAVRGGEMDLDAWVVFCIAWRFKTFPASQAYLFRALAAGRDRLSEEMLRLLLSAVHDRWVAAGHDGIRVEDLVNEVFDMVRVPRSLGVAMTDLQRSGAAPMLLGILIDEQAFSAFETVEAALSDTPEAAPVT